MSASTVFGFIIRDYEESVIATATRRCWVAETMSNWGGFFVLDCGIRNMIVENDDRIVITAI